MVARGSLLAVLLICASIYAESQSFYSIRRDRHLILHGGMGTSSYFGELNNPGDYIDAKPNINVGAQYFLKPRINVRADLTWFQLSGSDEEADESRKPRNLSFRSNNFELTATGAFYLFPIGTRFYQRPLFNVYGFAGVGYLFFNPAARLDGEWHALQPLKTEGVSYSRSQIVLPYGLGMRLRVGPFFNLALEGGYRTTFTDYLDDVSTVHQDKTTWTDPIAIALSDRGPEIGMEPRAPGSIRGNPDSNDGYFILNAKIEYYLPSSFGERRKLYTQKRKLFRKRN